MYIIIYIIYIYIFLTFVNIILITFSEKAHIYTNICTYYSIFIKLNNFSIDITIDIMVKLFIQGIKFKKIFLYLIFILHMLFIYIYIISLHICTQHKIVYKQRMLILYS